jgi:hypothetical protein
MSTIEIPFAESRIPYWAVEQLQPSRTALALNLLTQDVFTVYAPKIREQRIIRGGRTKVISALSPATPCTGAGCKLAFMPDCQSSPNREATERSSVN